MGILIWVENVSDLKNLGGILIQVTYSHQLGCSREPVSVVSLAIVSLVVVVNCASGQSKFTVQDVLSNGQPVIYISVFLLVSIPWLSVAGAQRLYCDETVAGVIYTLH